MSVEAKKKVAKLMREVEEVRRNRTPLTCQARGCDGCLVCWTPEQAYLAGAAEERKRAEGLVEALKEISDPIPLNDSILERPMRDQALAGAALDAYEKGSGLPQAG